MLSPSALYLLLLIPLLVAGYIWLLRRRRRFAVRYSSLELVREAASHQSRLRRHLPSILFLLALISLVFALTRPTAEIVVPSNRATIILALDVSRSMCSTDIPPNRLVAAQEAAIEFIQSQDKNTQIGVVAFAGFAELVQPPTKDRTLLVNAIANLLPARRTAIGSAILRSIDAIAEIDNRIPPTQLIATGGESFPAVEFAPHIIVLLTDGSSNAGPSPFVAANEATARGIRVYTIGFGTLNNTSPMLCGDAFSENDPFGGPGFGFGPPGGGGGFRRELDEFTLRQIADMTGGTYYAATSARELQDVFRNLPTYLVVTREMTEISALFNAAAVLLILLAFFLSLRWNPLM